MSFKTITAAAGINDNKIHFSDDLLDSDAVVDQLIREYDESYVPLPDIEYEPHILISKVRKHYMDYLIKVLSLNYETSQKLVNKSIYLPSAIWRCAKTIEMKAAQMCMVVQLYRKYIVTAIKELRTDTKRGKLNKNLYECLHRAPENEKKLQTTLKPPDCKCQCHHSLKRRRRNMSPESPFNTEKMIKNKDNTFQITKPQGFTQVFKINVDVSNKEMPQNNSSINISKPEIHFSPKSSKHMSIETQESDELMVQLEKLFQGDPNDADLFESALCDTLDSVVNDDIAKKIRNENAGCSKPPVQNQDSLVGNHSAEIKSLDERLVSLEMMLSNTTENNIMIQDKVDPQKVKKPNSTKWLCEEYFLKTRYFELLDLIGDTNRKKLARIKELLLELFGEDSDDEGMVSPLEETPEFILSCKERIAPWIVKLLTPYYIKGRIRGKALFKALAKHLIRLIYQCSRHPTEYEVQSFVSDFLENHKMITCEADYKQFRIENI